MLHGCSPDGTLPHWPGRWLICWMRARTFSACLARLRAAVGASAEPKQEHAGPPTYLEVSIIQLVVYGFVLESERPSSKNLRISCFVVHSGCHEAMKVRNGRSFSSFSTMPWISAPLDSQLPKHPGHTARFFISSLGG